MAKKGGGSTTQTQGLDPATQKYVDQVRQAAQTAGGSAAPGLGAGTQSAIDQYGQFMKGGNLGFNALSGDPTAMASFMNPYQSSVINATTAQYGNLRDQTMKSINDQATQAGAFGGSRAAIAQGAALGQLGQGEQQQIAQLEQSGYNDAASRAGQVANLGFGATGAMAGLGDYQRQVAMDQDPNLWRLKMLQQGMNTPYGQSSTTTQKSGHNGFSGALGGAATGGEIGSSFGPWGAGIGAGVGGLLGLFS